MPWDREPAPEVAESSVLSAVPAPIAGVDPGAVLELQSAIGNRAVARLVARAALSGRLLARDFYGELDRARQAFASKVANAKAGRFSDPAIQAVYDRNRPGTEAQQIALAWLDEDPASPPAGAWANLNWSKVSVQAAERVFAPNGINQKSLGVCDMAAVLNYEATVDPAGYAQMVADCFIRGTLKGRSINSKLLANTPMADQDQVDWMMLSAMTDLTNDVYSYYGRPDPAKPGLTDLRREGFLAGDDKWALTTFGGAIETKVIETPKAEDVIPATNTVNDLLRSHPNDVAVLIRLSATVLQNPAAEENNLNHTVRLTRPAVITDDADPTRGSVRADVFTWGRILPWSGTERQYQHMVWAYVAASRTKGIL